MTVGFNVEDFSERFGRKGEVGETTEILKGQDMG